MLHKGIRDYKKIHKRSNTGNENVQVNYISWSNFLQLIAESAHYSWEEIIIVTILSDHHVFVHSCARVEGSVASSVRTRKSCFLSTTRLLCAPLVPAFYTGKCKPHRSFLLLSLPTSFYFLFCLI